MSNVSAFKKFIICHYELQAKCKEHNNIEKGVLFLAIFPGNQS